MIELMKGAAVEMLLCIEELKIRVDTNNSTEKNKTNHLIEPETLNLK